MMATNLRTSIDDALQSRVGETVQFSYPNLQQCKQHFAFKASLGQGSSLVHVHLSSGVPHPKLHTDHPYESANAVPLSAMCRIFSSEAFCMSKFPTPALRPLVPQWHWLLAASSRLLLMDFRELEAVHKLVCERDVDQTNGAPDDTETTVACSDYLFAMWSVWQQRNPGSRAWNEMDRLKFFIWQLPYFTYFLRTLRGEMRAWRRALRARL